MIVHSVFLRKSCVLPNSVELRRKSISDHWAIVGELAATAFDRMVRQEGWHFVYRQGSYSRKGVGQTREEAIHQALNRALKGLTVRFNAAELELIQVSRFPLFQVANGHAAVAPHPARLLARCRGRCPHRDGMSWITSQKFLQPPAE